MSARFQLFFALLFFLFFPVLAPAHFLPS